MNQSTRDDLERALRARRAELFREAARCEADLRNISEEREVEFEERATEAGTEHLLAHLDDRGRREIVEINAALDRIADDVYGRCTRCAEPIAIARLVALPAAALCVRCARAAE